MCVWRGGTHGVQKRTLGFKVQVVGNCLRWVLETQTFFKVSVLLTPCVKFSIISV